MHWRMIHFYSDDQIIIYLRIIIFNSKDCDNPDPENVLCNQALWSSEEQDW